VHATGAFKTIYKGLYTQGLRRGEECVFKKFKQHVQNKPTIDVKAADKAAYLIDRFNRERLTTLKIRINIPQIMTTGGSYDRTRWLVEPFCP
jgi:hypothetical protein